MHSWGALATVLFMNYPQSKSTYIAAKAETTSKRRQLLYALAIKELEGPSKIQFYACSHCDKTRNGQSGDASWRKRKQLSVSAVSCSQKINFKL